MTDPLRARFPHAVLIAALIGLVTIAAHGEEDGDGHIEPGENKVEELAKSAQNPVSSLISVPFQNNTNYQVGPRDRTQNVLNIQSVIPFSLNEDWNVITRTILPVVSQPSFVPGQDR